ETWAGGTALTSRNVFDLPFPGVAHLFGFGFEKVGLSLWFNGCGFALSLVGQCSCPHAFRQLAPNKPLIVYP
ncbi:MAG: hypothetical protein WCD34_16710, partial [Candidatus Acidiferrum sp.]